MPAGERRAGAGLLAYGAGFFAALAWTTFRGRTLTPSISTDGECLWVVWSDNDSDVRGVSTCTPPTLAATGAEAAPLAAVGVLALLLGAVGIAVSRRRSVNEA